MIGFPAPLRPWMTSEEPRAGYWAETDGESGNAAFLDRRVAAAMNVANELENGRPFGSLPERTNQKENSS